MSHWPHGSEDSPFREDPALLPVVEAPPQVKEADDLTAVIHQLRKHQASHQSWLDHYLIDPNHTCGRCTPEVLAGVGDAVEQEVSVKVYDGLIARVTAAQLKLRQIAASCASRTPAEPEIEHFWTAVERGWDIEPRSYFEREAVPMGFKSPVEMAVHWMWKRHAKDWPAPAEPEGWQRMETAPKDGTMVLLFGEDLRQVGGMVTARWIAHDIELWHVEDGKFEPRPLRGPMPTHWMPLPPSPAEKAPTR